MSIITFSDIGLERPTAKFFFSPSDVSSEMLTVDTGVDQLALDMKKADAVKKVSPAFVSAYSNFFWEWKKWRKEYDTWAHRHERSVYEKVLEYRYRLAEWREKFEKLGGETPGVSLSSAPPVKQSEPGQDLNDVLKTVAIVGGLAIVGSFVMRR